MRTCPPKWIDEMWVSWADIVCCPYLVKTQSFDLVSADSSDNREQEAWGEDWDHESCLSVSSHTRHIWRSEAQHCTKQVPKTLSDGNVNRMIAIVFILSWPVLILSCLSLEAQNDCFCIYLVLVLSRSWTKTQPCLSSMCSEGVLPIVLSSVFFLSVADDCLLWPGRCMAGLKEIRLSP